MADVWRDRTRHPAPRCGGDIFTCVRHEIAYLKTHMKSFKRLVSLLTLVLAPLASASVPQLWTRSIMDSCEFVYRVESDIKLELPAGLMEIYDPELLYWDVSFSNSWDREPRHSEHFKWVPNEQGVVEITLETMSTSGGYLFRDMFFRVMIKGVDGELVSLTPAFQADIGRRFGELCATSRSPAVPFQVREVSEVPDR